MEKEVEKSKLYLAVNYGSYEGWKLQGYNSIDEVIKAIYAGNTYGNEFKVFKELDSIVFIPP